MGSVLAVLDAKALKPHAKSVVPGAVLPIDRYLTEETSFATHLSLGGALYLVAAGAAGEVLLIAVIETPECARVKRGDTRAPGWYGPVNTTPVTDVSKLRKRLKLGKTLEPDEPIELPPTVDKALRELLDDVEAPVLVEVATAAPAPEVSGPPLTRAATLLAGSHLVAAIEAMKEAWRVSRDPAIADLIDRATRLTPEYHRPLYDKRELYNWNAGKGGKDNKLWRATLEADPATNLPQLLLNLRGTEQTSIPDRAKQLAALPEDPRIGLRLIQIIDSAPNWESDAFWKSLIEIWIRSRDLRVLDEIRILGSEIDATGTQATKLRALARNPGKTIKVPIPTAEELDRRTAIEQELYRLEESLRTECALVDEIAANRDDDGPYLVYADWLIERGRPLGEFISLACQEKTGALSAAQARRYQTLIEVPYLCGPFDDLPTSRLRKRDRGIDRTLSAYWGTTPRSWRVVATSPLVRALESIELIGDPREGREDALVELIEAAPALRRIDNLGKTAATAIAKRCEQQAAVDGDDLVIGGVAKKATRGGRPR